MYVHIIIVKRQLLKCGKFEILLLPEEHNNISRSSLATLSEGKVNVPAFN